MKLFRQSIWLLGIAACSTAPTAPAGLHVRIEPNATVVAAGDSLRIRATIINESDSPHQIVGLTCQAIVDVFANSTNTRLPVSNGRICTLAAGSTMLPPRGELSDVVAFATTESTGASSALAEGIYRVRARFGVIGYGELRSDYVTVTVSR